MKKVIGYIMCSIPLVLIFIVAGITVGWLRALAIFVSCIILALLIIVGTYLIANS